MRSSALALAALLLAACADPAPAPAAPAPLSGPAAWTVTDTTLTFVATAEGKPISGRFDAVDTQIVLDPDALDTAQIRITVDTASVTTDNADANGLLPGRSFLAVRDFPVATFTSTAITRTAPGTNRATYRADGTLTVRDITRPLVLPFALDIVDDTATASGTLTLSRADYGVGQGDYATDQWIAHPVTLDFAVTATR